MEENETKKKKQNRHNQVDTSDGDCLLDGCFYIDFGACVDFGGCISNRNGCFNLGGCLGGDGDGCVDFGGCFDIGDACTFAPLKLIVILGLMLYGDWDYVNRRAKNRNL